MEGLNFYPVQQPIFNVAQQENPLRVLLVTSIRDVGIVGRAGQQVNIAGTQAYMKGTLEALLEASNKRAPYEQSFEVVGVIVDDIKNKDNLEDFDMLPTPDGKWILSTDYVYRNNPIEKLVHHCPSEFRKISFAHKSKRRKKKRDFESSILTLARSLEADVVLSDSLLIILENLHHHIFTINIHPAITNESSPYCARGKTPIEDMISRANDKEIIRTGASLHVINDQVDDGQVIVDSSNIVVQKEWSPQELRYHIFRRAKNPIAIVGLAYLKKIANSLKTV